MGKAAPASSVLAILFSALHRIRYEVSSTKGTLIFFAKSFSDFHALDKPLKAGNRPFSYFRYIVWTRTLKKSCQIKVYLRFLIVFLVRNVGCDTFFDVLDN